jgi:secreted PhoX family phosphatase
VSNYERDYPDHTKTPGFSHGDEPPCNTSANPTFYDVVDARTSRRGFLAGGLATAVGSVFGAGFSMPAADAQTTAAAPQPLIGFKPVKTSMADTVTVPEGYQVQVLGAWGEPINGNMPGFKPGQNTGAEQASQIGMHHDGMHFFPINGSSTDGLIVVNHEYVEPRYLHAAYKGKEMDLEAIAISDNKRDADEVLKEINAHGVSIYRAKRGTDGKWSIAADPLNRRITSMTRMELSGPVRGTSHLVTKFSPDGTATRGTINNCAHGVTPWNTFMTAEENWAGYFRNGSRAGDRPNLPREQSRYGVSTARGRYGWELAAGGADEFIRFDVTPKGQSAKDDYRNEANGFGWMVEIDPFNPQSTPVKRTHLGRFAHEGVVFAPAKAGKPVVCYSGDDARFEYIYKFVSAKTYDAPTANGSLLDEGTLYVAKFNPDGTGEWLALAPGKNGLTPENGFADLADILINTRLAADKAGATKMDRPEWGSVDPNTGEVYFTLTNNTSRTEAQVDPMNPRAVNSFGQIIRWREAGDDHGATSFKWELFVLAGNVQTSRTFNKRSLTADNIFACPDGLWFDPAGRLWIQTDMGEGEMYRGVLEPMGSNQMLCADPRTGEIRRFLTGPIGQEITGVIMTPDQKAMFVNVQHPGATTLAKEFAEGKYRSSWPDGNGAMPRSATLVISRIDGGVVGT